MVGGVISQASKDVSRDLGTFLDRVGVDRVNASELRCQPGEGGQLTIDNAGPRIGNPGRALRLGTRIYGLPATGDQIGSVLGKKTMEECRPAARQPHDEDRLVNSLMQNLGVIRLRPT